MKTSLAALLFCAIGSTAFAQAAYCPAPGLQSMIGNQNGEVIQVLKEKCKPGDTIALLASETGLIATACDFTKSMTFNGRNVICVLGQIRIVR